MTLACSHVRQQQRQVAILQRGQALEDVLEVGPRIVSVEFGRFDQAHQHSGTLAGQLRLKLKLKLRLYRSRIRYRWNHLPITLAGR